MTENTLSFDPTAALLLKSQQSGDETETNLALMFAAWTICMCVCACVRACVPVPLLPHLRIIIKNFGLVFRLSLYSSCLHYVGSLSNVV